MEIIHKKEGKTGWQFTAVENGKKLGNIIFSRQKEGIAHIGWINSKEPGVGSELMSTVIEFCSENGFQQIIGTLMPTPGFERALIGLCEKFGFEINYKNHKVKKTL